MSITTTTTERRKHRRYRVCDSLFAAVRPFSPPGLVKQISLAAIEYHYIDLEEEVPAPRAAELDILLPGITDSQNVENIPVQVVSDTPLPQLSPFGLGKMRRRVLRYRHLSPVQKFRISQLINQHAWNGKSPHPANRGKAS